MCCGLQEIIKCQQLISTEIAAAATQVQIQTTLVNWFSFIFWMLIIHAHATSPSIDLSSSRCRCACDRPWGRFWLHVLGGYGGVLDACRCHLMKWFRRWAVGSWQVRLLGFQACNQWTGGLPLHPCSIPVHFNAMLLASFSEWSILVYPLDRLAIHPWFSWDRSTWDDGVCDYDDSWAVWSWWHGRQEIMIQRVVWYEFFNLRSTWDGVVMMIHELSDEWMRLTAKREEAGGMVWVSSPCMCWCSSMKDQERITRQTGQRVQVNYQDTHEVCLAVSVWHAAGYMLQIDWLPFLNGKKKWSHLPYAHVSIA